MRSSWWVRVGVTAAVLAAGTTACDGSEDDEAGLGVPQQLPAGAFLGERVTVRARIHLASNGCFLGSLPDAGEGRRYLVVWPAGTTLGSSGAELVLPDGTAVGDRDVLRGTGLLMPTRRLEGFGTSSYWQQAVDFCTPRAAKVLVWDSAPDE